MSHYDGPKLGATFIPGSDDFFMPAQAEIVSPSPQRLTPEVPEQIQNNLAALELDAAQVTAAHTRKTPSPFLNSPTDANEPQRHIQPGLARSPYVQTQSPPHHGSQASTIHPLLQELQQQRQTLSRTPNFSPFPMLKHRPSNVPMSDAEREATLESARNHVLGATDPEMQLSWAQDALRYVDITLEDEKRSPRISVSASTSESTVRQLQGDALNIVNFLADQQHPRADFIRGTWLEFGKFGITQDKPEAFRCYKRASERGYARAFYRQGMLFESTGETVQALQNYHSGEAAGDAASCYRIGMMALLGQLGQPQDFGRAISLIQHAADNADENAPQAAYVFGMLQARELPQIAVPDRFLPLNIDNARLYIEKSAFLGFSKAQLKMASAYELCTLHCDFNPALSLHYNALAARQCEAEADMAISKWFLCGYEGVFRRSDELAFLYAQRAAENNLATAEFAMGYFHEVGIHVKVDLSSALAWYRRAQEQGNKDAEDRVKSICAKDTLSKKDHETVAVSRLKSQHGSRRGSRPIATNFPGIQPRLKPVYEGQPFRSSSTPPYPLNEAPFRPASDHRSSSVAPYPQDDRPVLTAPYPLDDPRRPASTARPSEDPGFLTVDSTGRPRSADGFGNLTPHLATRLQGQSHGSNKPSSTEFDSRPPEGYATRPTSSTGPPPRPAKEQLTTRTFHSSTGSHADVAYVAPLDIKSAVRKPVQPANSSQKGHSQMSAPSAAVDISSPSSIYSPRSGTSEKKSSKATSSSQPAPRPSRPTAQDSSLPPKPWLTDKVSQVRSSTSSRTGSKASPLPPPKTASGKQHPATASTKPSTVLPGKGPKTFEEMGVPTTKNDSECSLM